MTNQVKSKQHVADQGEVFTADREVNAMLGNCSGDESSTPGMRR